LFAFSGFPIFEYSVMARNHGLAMPFIFALADRMLVRPRPYILIGGLLFLLAQTNVHSALLVPFYLLLTLPKRGASSARERSRFLLCAAIAGAGLLAAFATVYPLPPRTMFMETFAGQFAKPTSLLWRLAWAILDPGQYFKEMFYLPLLGALPPLVGTLLLYAATFGLLPRPLLWACAISSLWTMTAFFVLVYPGSYRHEGIWLLFLISLYWIRLGKAGAQPFRAVSWHSRIEAASLFGVLGLLLAINGVIGARMLWLDYRNGMGNAYAVGALIRSNARLHDAIILPDPVYIGDAIAYYVPNDMYLTRDRMFGRYGSADVSSYVKGSQSRLSLTELLNTARSLKTQTGRPILIVLEWDLDDTCPTDVCIRFNFQFTYTQQERQEFFDSTQKLRVKRRGVLEGMDAYLLK
jgi:hypothetical protein